MALLFSQRALLANKLPSTKIFCRNGGYMVLIPEIGEDLPENGSLLKTNGLPEFNSISVEKCMAAVGIQAHEFEKGVNEVVKRFTESPHADIFTHIFQPLEILGAPLDTTWGLSKTLYLGNNTSMPTNNYLAIHEHAKRARASKFNSSAIYNSSKNDLNMNKQRNKEETRVIQKFILEGRLNGLELNDDSKAKLQQNRKTMLEEKRKFRLKVENATKQFKHLITDFSVVRDFPQDLLQAMATNPDKINEGPWEVTLVPHIYNNFMEHCPDRSLRFNAWLSMVTRGAVHRTKELATSVHLEQIRFLRQEQARILGYSTFADISMETKMAGNVSNVKNFLHNFVKVAKPAQDMELARLYEFAKERGFEGERLELWDVPYWNKKLQKKLFNYQEDDVKQYFPLTTVLEGFFKVCEQFFGIHIVARNEVSVWHKGVKFYDIFDKDSQEPVAGFYLDLFSTSEEKTRVPVDKGWMVAIQNCSKIASTKPLAALIFNYRRVGPNQPILLSFKDVELLFGKFGQAFQHLLTCTTYAEVAGVSNIEWDTVGTCEHVFSHLLNIKEVIKNISRHVENGDVIPDELINSVIKSRTLTSGIDLCQELYLSALDIELHTTKAFWLEIVKRLWPEYRSFPLNKLDSHPSSFSQIFSEDWSAAYYSHLWSRMIAADVYGAFHDVKDDMEQVATIGKRFRNTFLALGGSCNPNELFRLFRGRDPSHKALLRSLGLRKIEENGDQTLKQ